MERRAAAVVTQLRVVAMVLVGDAPPGLAYQIAVAFDEQDDTPGAGGSRRVTGQVIRRPGEVVRLHQQLVERAAGHMAAHGIELATHLVAGERDGTDGQQLLSSHLLVNRAQMDALQSYLQQLLAVPELARSDALLAFTANATLDASATTPHPSAAALRPRPSEDSFPQVGPDSFARLKVLGQGSMGKVVLARKKDSQKLYALKIIRKEWVILQSEVVHTKAERDILVAVTQSKHPFLVTLYHSFQTERDLYLVLEYCPGGDLASQLTIQRKFNLPAAAFYAAEIVLGLEELHRMGIIYRDLKPENILIDRAGHIVLSDFGLSKQFASASAPFTKTFCGTTDYLAPEILRGEEYSFAVDWWSLGTLVYEMLVGITPFYHSNHHELYRRVLEARLAFPASVDPNAKHLIMQLLDRNPSTRLGRRSNGIRDIKTHPFFCTVDWAKAFARQLLPPFVPKLAAPDDVSHFDAEFTALPVDDDDSQASLAAATERIAGLNVGATPENSTPALDEPHRGAENEPAEPVSLADVSVYFFGFSYDGDQDSLLQSVNARRRHRSSSSVSASSLGASASSSGSGNGSAPGNGHGHVGGASTTQLRYAHPAARRLNNDSTDSSYDGSNLSSPRDPRTRPAQLDSSASAPSSLDDMNVFKRTVTTTSGLRPAADLINHSSSTEGVRPAPQARQMVQAMSDGALNAPPSHTAVHPSSRPAFRTLVPTSPRVPGVIPSSPRSPHSDHDFHGDGYDGNILLLSPRRNSLEEPTASHTPSPHFA